MRDKKKIIALLITMIVICQSSMVLNVVLSHPINDFKRKSSVKNQNLDLNSNSYIDTNEVSINDQLLENSFVIFTPAFDTDETGIFYYLKVNSKIVAGFGRSSVYYQVENHTLNIQFPGSKLIEPKGLEMVGSTTNYLLGNDSNKWQTGLNDYKSLIYNNLYSGIDLVYKIVNGELKYEFHVSKHSDPSIISMQYINADKIFVNEGDLNILFEENVITDADLFSFEAVTSSVVDCAFNIEGLNIVKFDIKNWSGNYNLVIDPYIQYSTFFGGASNWDNFVSVSVDDQFIYLCGSAASTDLYISPGAYDPDYNGGNEDVIVVKMTRNCSQVIFSTYIGGTTWDCGYSVHGEYGYAYIAGWTHAGGFPGISGSFDPTFNGDRDGFVCKLNQNGSDLLFSTFIGGVEADYTHDMVVDSDAIYIVGNTESTSATFPVTAGAYDTTHGGVGISDVYVAKLLKDGSNITWCTYLGDSSWDDGYGIAVEDGYCYVTGLTDSPNFPVNITAPDNVHSGGQEGFISKLSPDGSQLLYSSFIGGSANDAGRAICVENGYAFVGGYTHSNNFPTAGPVFGPSHNGGKDGFVTCISPDGSSFYYSTYLGGLADDEVMINGLQVRDGVAYVAGNTQSSNFSTTSNAMYPELNGTADAFFSIIRQDGSDLAYSTFIGRSGQEYCEGIYIYGDYAYLCGSTTSSDFYTSPGAFNESFNGVRDAYCIVISLSNTPDGGNPFPSGYKSTVTDKGVAIWNDAVYVDTNGIVHVLYHDNNGNALYEKNSTDGIVWSSETTLRSGVDVFTARVFQNPNGIYFLIMSEQLSGSNMDLYIRTSSDGVNWNNAVRISNTSDWWEFSPSIVWRSDTDAYLFYNKRHTAEDSTGAIVMRNSTDGGTTWNDEIVVVNTSAFQCAPMAVLVGNQIVLTWTEKPSLSSWDNAEVFSRIWYGDRTWSSPLQMTNNSIEDGHSTLVTDGISNVWLFFISYTDAHDCYYFYSNNSGNTWSASYPLVNGSNSQSYPYGWYDFQSDSIYYIWNDGPWGAAGQDLRFQIAEDMTRAPFTFCEDWENGINSSKWKLHGSPSPAIDSGMGRGGGDAVDTNGDGSYGSGMVSYQNFNLSRPTSLEFWANIHARGETPTASWQIVIVGFSVSNASTFTSDGDQPGWVCYIRICPETSYDHIRYVVGGETHEVDFPNGDAGSYHHYALEINTNQTVSFYKDGSHVYTSTATVNTAYTSQPVHIDGRSSSTTILVDDLVIINDEDPTIVLDAPLNNSIMQKPSLINLTIQDINLDTVLWRAGVTQTTWSSSFVGTYDIDLSSFSPDQTVQFWVYAKDTWGNSNYIRFLLTFDDSQPIINLTSATNNTILAKPATLNFTVQDFNLDTVMWRANVTQITWSTAFVGNYDIDLSGFASDQPVHFWFFANDSAANSDQIEIILTFDDSQPIINLTSLNNNSVLSKPTTIDFTIQDLNLDIVMWRANVTQTTWSTDFVGTYDINLSSFASDQPVRFWVYANDSSGNSDEIQIILTFDNSQPQINLTSATNSTIIPKPPSLAFNIQDLNLDTIMWRANVTQTTWSTAFVGSYEINLSSFASDQPVHFWVYANDSASNSDQIEIFLTFDDSQPIINLLSVTNNSIISKPATLNFSVQDLSLDTVMWRANVTQTTWSTGFVSGYEIDLSSFASDQPVHFWVYANDSTTNSKQIEIILTFDNSQPIINLLSLTNNSVLSKPAILNFTIQDLNLEIAMWRANVTQTTWSTEFVGIHEIDLSSFASDQPVHFWVYANDSAGNSLLVEFIFIFSESTSPPDYTIIIIIIIIGAIAGIATTYTISRRRKIPSSKMKTKIKESIRPLEVPVSPLISPVDPQTTHLVIIDEAENMFEISDQIDQLPLSQKEKQELMMELQGLPSQDRTLLLNAIIGSTPVHLAQSQLKTVLREIDTLETEERWSEVVPELEKAIALSELIVDEGLYNELVAKYEDLQAMLASAKENNKA